jgi:DNA gyrase/topoisomerase IV subunit B
MFTSNTEVKLKKDTEFLKNYSFDFENLKLLLMKSVMLLKEQNPNFDERQKRDQQKVLNEYVEWMNILFSPVEMPKN